MRKVFEVEIGLSEEKLRVVLVFGIGVFSIN